MTPRARPVYMGGLDTPGALYGFTLGLFKGIGLGVIRTVVGGYELLTFPIPANDYEPVVLPAYPFEPGPTETP